MQAQFRLAALSFAALCTASTAFADIPPGGGRHRHGSVHKCAEMPANATGTAPNQTELDNFLHNVAYQSVTAPEITKLDDGSYRVCATFTR